MKLLNLAVVFCAAFVLCSCSENGDKPIAIGKGLGYDYEPQDPSAVIRVSVQNSFTRGIVAAVDSDGKHYEITVGPIREGFLILPKGSYEYSAWTKQRNVGQTKLNVKDDSRGAIEGVLLQIRP